MNHVILYRNCDEWDAEKNFVVPYFHITNTRMSLKKDDLVVGRFSCLPFYREQANDLELIGAKFINSYAEHNYIADLKEWYDDLKDFTPATWDDMSKLPSDTSFILKGQTNSKKFHWNTHMFARDKRDAMYVYHNLSIDGLVGNQTIYAREYVPLKTYAISINELPITNEWRIFCYRDQILSKGYYWSNYVDDIESDPESPDMEFVQKIANIVSQKTNYYTIDVAQKEDGSWIVIELNDGQMSGLSENSPRELYPKLLNSLVSHLG